MRPRPYSEIPDTGSGIAFRLMRPAKSRGPCLHRRKPRTAPRPAQPPPVWCQGARPSMRAVRLRSRSPFSACA